MKVKVANREGGSKQARSLGGLSIMTMSLLLMVAEMWTKRKSINEFLIFQWLSWFTRRSEHNSDEEGRSLVSKPNLFFKIFFHHLLNFHSGDPLKVVYFSIFESSVGNFFCFRTILVWPSTLGRVSQKLFISPLFFTIYSQLFRNLLYGHVCKQSLYTNAPFPWNSLLVPIWLFGIKCII